MHFEGILFSLPILLLYLVFASRSYTSLRKVELISLIFIKVSFGFLLQAFYTYYYQDRSTADIYRFFDDGILLLEYGRSNLSDFVEIILGIGNESNHMALFEQMNSWIKPFDSGIYNDNHFMIKLNALIGIVSFGYYEVHSVIFTLFATQGLIWLIEAMVNSQEEKRWAYYLVFLFPSSLIWLSGGLKESILILGLGAFINALVSWKSKESTLRIIQVFLGLLILVSVKLYFVLALVPAMIIWAIDTKRSLGMMNQVLLWLGIWVGGLILSTASGFDLLASIMNKRHEFINHVRAIDPGSAFSMEYLHHDWTSFAFNLPNSLLNTIARPYLWEVSSFLELIMSFESIDFLFVIGLLMVALFKGQFRSSMFWVLLFIAPIILLIGFTTPVFGAIMRYRAPTIIFLLILAAPILNGYVQRLTSKG